MTYAKTSRAGFTLMEMLIVLAIIAIISLVLAPIGMNQVKKGRIDATKVMLRKVQAALDLYQADVGQYPDTLRDLMQRPSDEETAKNWNGPYVKEMPKDGFKTAIQYQPTAEGEHEYELYSYGPKGKKGAQSERISVWKEQ